MREELYKEFDDRARFLFRWSLWLAFAFHESAHIQPEKMKRVIDMVAVGMLCVVANFASLFFLEGIALAASLVFFGIVYLVDGLIYHCYVMAGRRLPVP